MTAAVRIETRTGKTLICSLGPYADLPTWWNRMRADDQIVGQSWALPFDQVTFAEFVHLDEEKQESLPLVYPSAPRAEIDKLTQAVIGGWRPPGDGH